MADVAYRSASRIYPGSEHPAVAGLDLEISDGEFLVLVGPSGSGKSTALRMLAGLEQVDGGSIEIGARDVTALAPKERDIAMVFQNYALYPHMSVAQNMGFALKIAGVKKDEIARRVQEAARLLDLEAVLSRRPRSLSGGQRQRVAMGRAIVREPQVFLMDEPLSNLDAKLRVQTRTQIAELQRRLGVTTVYVTHDQVEAMTMGDRVAVLKDGLLQQCDSPRAMYERPANVFVAGFIGSPAMNLVDLDLDSDGGARRGPIAVALPAAARAAAEREGLGRVTVGFRPESLTLVGGSVADGDAAGGIPVIVNVVEELGADAYLYGSVGEGEDRVDLTARVDGRHPPQKGDRVTLRLGADALHVFSPATGERLEG